MDALRWVQDEAGKGGRRMRPVNYRTREIEFSVGAPGRDARIRRDLVPVNWMGY